MRDNIYSEVKLINTGDFGMVRLHLMYPDEVRMMNVPVRVDTNVLLLTINEHIQEFMQFPFAGKETRYTTDCEKIGFDIVGPIMIEWKNRSTHCNAVVLPGNSEPILGRIPLYAMDLMVSTQEQRLMGKHHPDYPIFRI